MAQHVGAASSALFVEQAEASVADKYQSQACRKGKQESARYATGRKHGRTSIEEGFFHVLYVNSNAIVPCCKCKIEIWIVLSEFAHNTLIGESSEKSAGWIRKKLEVNGGPSRKLRPPR